MKITQYSRIDPNHDTFNVNIERLAGEAIMDQFAKALEEAARHYVDQNMDKITAKLDVAGLGNLIAIYAGKKIAESLKE